MNVNDLAALNGYSALKPAPDGNLPVAEMSERFAAIFDKADQAVQGFATQHVDAQAMVEALSEAEMALQTAVTIRDRVVAAYQEILRMPL
jgi:flagellar hook-basal body complex protein FliE